MALKKVYLDCTFTYQSGLNTGIQRVVRNIVSRADIAKNEFGIEFIPVICMRDRYYRINVSDILKVQPTIASIGRSGKNFLASVRAKLPQKFAPVLDVFETLLRRGFAVIKKIRVAWTAFCARRNRVEFQESDIFVLLDVFWTYDFTRAITKSNRGPKKVVSVIYDLIPITHPQFVEEVNCRNFASALPKIFEVVDEFICISDAVVSDLRHYAKGVGRGQMVASSFRLGSDFLIKTSSQVPKQEIAAPFTGGKPWLVIGTIEPRKNHSFILDAFDFLWSQGSDEKVVIVGRVGWMCDDLMLRISQHPLLGEKLFLLNSVTDAELQYCYSHGKGLIFASHAEGFGLPLVEAMASGLPILCSDIPVFREIGGEYPSYFSLGNSRELALAITQSRDFGRASRDWPGWDDSLREFLRKI